MMRTQHQRRDTAIFVVVEYTPPATESPFKTWKELKDFARDALTNGSSPGGTEISNPSATGRTAGFVICRSRQDAYAIYGKLEQHQGGGARVHLFDTSDLSKPGGLLVCNCPGGHNNSSTYYSSGYIRCLSTDRPSLYTDPALYQQPFGWMQVTGRSDSMSLLNHGISNLGLSSTAGPSTEPVLYPSQGSATYMSGHGVPNQAGYPGAPPPSSYATYPSAQYSPGYGMTSGGYTDHYNMASQVGAYDTYGVIAQPPNAYQQYTPLSYGNAFTPIASPGYESESAAAQPTRPTTPPGYVRTERNVLIMSNLDPKTNENDIRKEVDKIAPAVHVKINKYEHHAKRSISAIVTFSGYGDMKKVKDHFEKKDRHIRNRKVAVRAGKDSIKVSGPLVVSSDP